MRFLSLPLRYMASGAVVVLLALIQPSLALATAATFTFPISRVDTNPCTGETIPVTGTLHVDVVTNASTSGNFLVHESDKESVTGTALQTGASYVGETEAVFDYTVAAGSTYTHDLTVLMIRQGETLPADDYYVHTLMHMTVDANGVPTATVDNPTLTCR